MKNLKTLVLVGACGLLLSSAAMHAQGFTFTDDFSAPTIHTNWSTFGGATFVRYVNQGDPIPAGLLSVGNNQNRQGVSVNIGGTGPWSASMSLLFGGYMFNTLAKEVIMQVDFASGRTAGFIFINDGSQYNLYGVDSAAGSLVTIMPMADLPQGGYWTDWSIANDGAGNTSYSMDGVNLWTGYYSGSDSPVNFKISGTDYATPTLTILVDNISITTVPEPSTYALVGFGAMAVFASKRLRSRSGI